MTRGYTVYGLQYIVVYSRLGVVSAAPSIGDVPRHDSYKFRNVVA